mmetsp:Transcript_5281/g.21309  ORF Transcript_5281/g.21309 Transcript_5281/m.21309 type:complete len:381 (+) Transcript_5281:1766-2908(+)
MREDVLSFGRREKEKHHLLSVCVRCGATQTQISWRRGSTRPLTDEERLQERTFRTDGEIVFSFLSRAYFSIHDARNPSLLHPELFQDGRSEFRRVQTFDLHAVVVLDDHEQRFARPRVVVQRGELRRIRGEHLQRLVSVVEDDFFQRALRGDARAGPVLVDVHHERRASYFLDLLGPGVVVRDGHLEGHGVLAKRGPRSARVAVMKSSKSGRSVSHTQEYQVARRFNDVENHDFINVSRRRLGTPSSVAAWRAGRGRRDVRRGREQDGPGGEHPQVAGRWGLDVERRRRGRRVRDLSRRVRRVPTRCQVPRGRLAGGLGPVRPRVPPAVHHEVAQLADGAEVPDLPRRLGVRAGQERRGKRRSESRVSRRRRPRRTRVGG